MTYENPPRNDEEVETLEDERQLSKSATAESKIEGIIERSTETPLGISESDKEKIAELKKSIESTRSSEELSQLINNALQKKEDGSDNFIDTRLPEEKQQPEKISSKNKVTGLRKVIMALGFAFAGLTGQAKDKTTEGNFTDSTQNKIEKSISSQKINFIESGQEVAGITLDGMISVPMTDTTYEYFFLGFSGNNKDKHKLGKMIEASTKLGYELGSPEELKKALDKNGDNIVRATGGYGMSLKNARTDVDDTKNVSINNKVSGPETHNLTTFNPTGNIGKYEIEAIEKTGLNYEDYKILVKKKKLDEKTVTYTDVAKSK